MSKTTVAASPTGGAAYLISSGTPIEICPVCEARVCRSVMNPGTKRAIPVLLTLPEEFEFPDTWGEAHRCARALAILNDVRDRRFELARNPPLEPTLEESDVPGERAPSEAVTDIGYQLPNSTLEETA